MANRCKRADHWSAYLLYKRFIFNTLKFDYGENFKFELA